MLTLLRLRGIESVRATVIISVLSLLIYAPLYALVFGFDRVIAVGWMENITQVVAQGHRVELAHCEPACGTRMRTAATCAARSSAPPSASMSGATSARASRS